jgi:hypothetical protein
MSFGKGEVESSILSRSTIKSQGLSTLSDFPWENGAFQKYATKRENTGETAKNWAEVGQVLQAVFSSCSLSQFSRGHVRVFSKHLPSTDKPIPSPFVCAASKDASAAPVNLAMATSY